MSDTAFSGWAILELMGHRRLAGMLSEVEVGGGKFVRIDVPGAGQEWAATQFYSPAAVYCITPTSEATAREVARSCIPAPVQRWELPAPAEVSACRDRHDEDDMGNDPPF